MKEFISFGILSNILLHVTNHLIFTFLISRHKEEKKELDELYNAIPKRSKTRRLYSLLINLFWPYVYTLLTIYRWIVFLKVKGSFAKKAIHSYRAMTKLNIVNIYEDN